MSIWQCSTPSGRYDRSVNTRRGQWLISSLAHEAQGPGGIPAAAERGDVAAGDNSWKIPARSAMGTTVAKTPEPARRLPENGDLGCRGNHRLRGQFLIPTFRISRAGFLRVSSRLGR